MPTLKNSIWLFWLGVVGLCAQGLSVACNWRWYQYDFRAYYIAPQLMFQGADPYSLAALEQLSTPFTELAQDLSVLVQVLDADRSAWMSKSALGAERVDRAKVVAALLHAALLEKEAGSANEWVALKIRAFTMLRRTYDEARALGHVPTAQRAQRGSRDPHAHGLAKAHGAPQARASAPRVEWSNGRGSPEIDRLPAATSRCIVRRCVG